MIEKLKIKNFAIIDDMTIDFKSGFSVIIGETGTGKSIIIEAINLILGERANNAMIKDGCEKSFLTGVFTINEEVKAYLNSCDIDYDEKIEIVRILNVNGRSSYKINGNIVSLSVINKVRNLIIEIKRQTDNDISTDEFYAIKLIDAYSKITDNEEYQKYQGLYKEYCNIQLKLSEVRDSTKNIDIEYVKMQINRIEEVSTFEGEYEELVEKSKIYANSFKITELSQTLKNNLNQLYEISSSVATDSSELSKLGIGFDIDYSEINIQIEDYVNSFDVDFESVSESEITYIEERIFSIKRLFDLYGGSFEGIETALANLHEQLYIYENSEHLTEKYEKELLELESSMEVVCTELNEYRSEAAEVLSSQVKKLFANLYMEDAAIKFSQEKAGYSKYGNINIELLISTNNSNFWPIEKIASGGERARIILAIKKVLVENSNVATIIFDEVDTGVSGRVALAMGELMKVISKNTQVISITHLPQVAANAQYCLSVEKSMLNEEVVSSVKYVEGEAKVEKIAQLLSGDKVSKEALDNARKLISS